MVQRLKEFDGNPFTTEGVDFADVNDSFDLIAKSLAPAGTVEQWLKTSATITTGSADTDSTDQLVDSSATFQTDGVEADNIVRNTTDGQYAIVDNVVSDTELDLRADTRAGSSTSDIFDNGNESYEIYATQELSPRWREANGQTVSDPDSPYDGIALPDLNGTSDSDSRFLRGHVTSEGTGGSATNSHGHDMVTDTILYEGGGSEKTVTTDAFTDDQTINTIPPYMDTVMIIRIK